MRQFRRTNIVVTVTLLGSSTVLSQTSLTVEQVAQRITEEATKSSSDPAGNPLPLAASWNVGQNYDGYHPDYMLQLIEKGYYVLPSFLMYGPGSGRGTLDHNSYRTALARCRQLGLPIVMKSTQWEDILLTDPAFTGLPPSENPIAMDLSGNYIGKLDMFGPSDTPYYDAGAKWGGTDSLKEYQELYPNPPLVLFLSNNEVKGMSWTELPYTRRWHDLYGAAAASINLDTSKESGLDFVYKTVMDRHDEGLARNPWTVGGRAPLHRGISDQLTTWKGRQRFIGFNSAGPRFYGRWQGWRWLSLSVEGRISPASEWWNGASMDFYLYPGTGQLDFHVYSLQGEAMNSLFIKKDILRQNPDFILEMSLWDGDNGHKVGVGPATPSNPFSELRYRAAAQYGMWILRPRIVRDFRSSHESRSVAGEYFEALAKGVRIVHDNVILKNFWRQGEPIPAVDQASYTYSQNTLSSYAAAERWFNHETNLGYGDPMGLWAPVPVWTLLLVRGSQPNRDWLLYTHSPSGYKRNVRVKVPGYGEVTFDSPVSGAFYYIREGQAGARKIYTEETRANNNLPLKSATAITHVANAQGLEVTFKDPDGPTDVLTADIWVGGQPDSNEGCYIKYHPDSGVFYYRSGNHPYWSTTKVDNGNDPGCRLDTSATAARMTSDGLVLAIKFHDSRPIKNTGQVFVQSEDKANNLVDWFPVAVSYVPFSMTLAPNTGAGGSGMFTVTVDHDSNINQVKLVYLQISSNDSVSNSCYVALRPSDGTFHLLSDTGVGYIAPVVRSGKASDRASNSQCEIWGKNSSVAVSGNRLEVRFGFTFTPSFVGVKRTWGSLVDQANSWSGRVVEGSWAVTKK